MGEPEPTQEELNKGSKELLADIERGRKNKEVFIIVVTRSPDEKEKLQTHSLAFGYPLFVLTAIANANSAVKQHLVSTFAKIKGQVGDIDAKD